MFDSSSFSNNTQITPPNGSYVPPGINPDITAKPDDPALPPVSPMFAKLNYTNPLKTVSQSMDGNIIGDKLKASRDKMIAKQQAKRAALDEYTKMNSNTVQDLYKNSKFRNHVYENGHDFRNQRHAEFLEQNPFAVRLKSMVAANTVVAFRTSPEISESASVAYKTIDPLHMPGAIQVFQNSAPRTWSISGIKLVSRNGIEAEENLAIINQLRAWRMPFFGSSSTQGREDYKYEMFGAPPEVLEFSAYSNPAAGLGLTNIRAIPVVIVGLTIPYPTDCDYIATATTQQPFPVLMTIDINLVETHSPRDFEQFDLIAFKNGKLRGF